MTQPVILSVQGLTKRYPGVVALDGVSFEVHLGEVVGLIGQNGAGKSTLLKILSGVIRPDEGTISVRGEEVRLRSAADASAIGIGIVHQEQSLVPNLTVAENIFLGRSPKATAGGIYRWKALREAAAEQLAKTGTNVDPGAIVESLPFAERQMIELTKVLTLEEHVNGSLAVLLDEPTSTLTSSEIRVLFEQIERLRARTGIVFVSHRMEEVLAVADRVYVLSEGSTVAERLVDEVDQDELYRLMVGQVAASRPRTHGGAKQAVPVRLEVRNLSRRGEFSGVDFSVGRGQVLGITGVVGSGRETLCRAVFGLEPSDEGVILLDGVAIDIASPRKAIAAGIGYVPAERRIEGVILGRSVLENIMLTNTRSDAKAGVVPRRAERRAADRWVQELSIKTPGVDADIATLSGGNQQKVSLAKWLMLPSLKVLILDHPTRGLDLKAKADVYQIIREAAAKGLSVLLLSDTLQELFELSDQVIVMKDGSVAAHYPDVVADRPDLADVVKEML